MSALKIYVTGILALWSVVGSFLAWECLCGHDVCEWCSHPSPAPVWLYGSRGGCEWSESDMITQYDLPRSQLGNV